MHKNLGTRLLHYMPTLHVFARSNIKNAKPVFIFWKAGWGGAASVMYSEQK